MASNYLGPFLLTQQLLPLLLKAPHPRIVNVSSFTHRCGKFHPNAQPFRVQFDNESAKNEVVGSGVPNDHTNSLNLAVAHLTMSSISCSENPRRWREAARPGVNARALEGRLVQNGSDL